MLHECQYIVSQITLDLIVEVEVQQDPVYFFKTSLKHFLIQRDFSRFSDLIFL